MPLTTPKSLPPHMKVIYQALCLPLAPADLYRLAVPLGSLLRDKGFVLGENGSPVNSDHWALFDENGPVWDLLKQHAPHIDTWIFGIIVVRGLVRYGISPTICASIVQSNNLFAAENEYARQKNITMRLRLSPFDIGGPQGIPTTAQGCLFAPYYMWPTILTALADKYNNLKSAKVLKRDRMQTLQEAVTIRTGANDDDPLANIVYVYPVNPKYNGWSPLRVIEEAAASLKGMKADDVVANSQWGPALPHRYIEWVNAAAAHPRFGAAISASEASQSGGIKRKGTPADDDEADDDDDDDDDGDQPVAAGTAPSTRRRSLTTDPAAGRDANGDTGTSTAAQPRRRTSTRTTRSSRSSSGMSTLPTIDAVSDGQSSTRARSTRSNTFLALNGPKRTGEACDEMLASPSASSATTSADSTRPASPELMSQRCKVPRRTYCGKRSFIV